MKLLPAPSVPQPAQATFRGALSNLGRAAYMFTARLANYRAAYPTATTQPGSRIGSNLNSTYASVQRSGMMWTSEMLQKDCPLAMAYLRVRGNYCRPTRWKPNTGDSALNKAVSEYCEEKWKTMGFACSMQAAVARTLHIETPIRGDAGMIIWRDESGDLRLIEFSADQVGEVYNFTPPRSCSIGCDKDGNICEKSGSDCIYFAGRYFRGPDCVAYKIYQRTDSWYSNARIYDARDVIYSVDPFNFRSMRGVTIFHNVMSCIQKGEDMLQAGLNAAQRQARTAMMVYNNSGSSGADYDASAYISGDPALNGKVKYSEFVLGGPITEYAYNGDSAQFMSPDSPGPELIEGVKQADQRFAIGLGMTYAFIVSGEALGGAISRLDANRSSNEIERLREDVSDPVLNRIAKITIMDGVRKRDLPAEQFISLGRWSYVNLPTADAFKDSMDDIKSVRAGQDSDTRVLARYGTTPEEILRDKEDETFLAYQSLDNVQKRLRDSGIKLTPSIADIRQITDNPQQAAAAEAIDNGEAPAVPSSKQLPAKMSAFIGDMRASELPDSVREEITKHIKGDPLISKYGMTVPELLSKADQHNLETARKNIRYCTNGSCSEEVHANEEKCILLNNDRIIDGHHFLAKAEKGKVSKSLSVIDISPARFQTASLAEWDESKHPRADDGEFGEGSDGKQKKVSEMSKGELKTHNLKKKLAAIKAGNAARADDLKAANDRVADLHSKLQKQLASKDTSNDELKKTVSDLGEKLKTVETHTATIQHALKNEDIAADEHGEDSPEHEAARKRTEYTARLAEWDESKHKRGQPGNKGEFGSGGGGDVSTDETKKKGADMKSYLKNQATHLHETAQSKGHADVNEFAANDPQGFSKTIADFQKDNPRSDAAKSQNLTPTKERAWSGGTMKVKTKLSKLETGALGEKAVIGYLKDKGYSDARTYETSRNNAPVDLLQDHELIEVKTGFAGNGDTAQHWRATIGQPGPEETKMLKTMSSEDKKKWNAAKSAAILKRKTDELKHYSKETGRKAQGKTIATIINPDTRTIDIHEFDGFHLRIPWNSPEAKAAYKGSYKY